jgi:uncharacterized protein YjbI with pentapeptide repeats
VKGILKFFIGTVLGALIGWSLGFLRFPVVEWNASFWIGFAASVAFILFFLALLFLWSKRFFLRNLRGKNQDSGRTAPSRSILLGIVMVLVLALGGMGGSWLGYNRGKSLKAKIQKQDQLILEQAEMMESVRQGNQSALMANVLNKIDEELSSQPDSQLTESTIARVVALSYSLKPYRYLSGDTLSDKKLSPERGQLLLALARMPINSVSFSKIKKDAPFFGADLRKANLQGTNLSGADLNGADLRDANLEGANLENVQLVRANLWGAMLDSANLSHANLRRADLQWAEINNADLSGAIMNGANLSDAKLRKTNLKRAEIQWAFADGALLIDANLTHADFLGTSLTRANLTNADLTEGNLMAVDLNDARLTGTNLSRVSCGADLLDNMTEWNIEEAAAYQAKFKVVDDTIRPFVSAVFRLQKNNP